MAENPHFASAPSWNAAGEMLTFQPRQPAFTAGRELQSLRIYVRDHKMRDLRIGERSLEVSYGRNLREGAIAGHPARIYELGPEPEPDDLDGRPPAVVTWHDGEMFFLIASGEMPVDELIPIAASMYSSQSG
jgi:hypothetical protein